MYNCAVQTCWPADKFHNLTSDRIQLDRWSTNRLCRAAKTRDNSLQHTSWLICRGLDREICDRLRPIRWNSIASLTGFRWFSSVPRPFDCSHASTPNWSVDGQPKPPANAFVQPRFVAIPNWWVCSIGWAILDVCGLAPHYKNLGRQYHLAANPTNGKKFKHFVRYKKTDIKNQRL